MPPALVCGALPGPCSRSRRPACRRRRAAPTTARTASPCRSSPPAPGSRRCWPPAGPRSASRSRSGPGRSAPASSASRRPATAHLTIRSTALRSLSSRSGRGPCRTSRPGKRGQAVLVHGAGRDVAGRLRLGQHVLLAARQHARLDDAVLDHVAVLAAARRVAARQERQHRQGVDRLVRAPGAGVVALLDLLVLQLVERLVGGRGDALDDRVSVSGAASCRSPASSRRPATASAGEQEHEARAADGRGAAADRPEHGMARIRGGFMTTPSAGAGPRPANTAPISTVSVSQLSHSVGRRRRQRWICVVAP